MDKRIWHVVWNTHGAWPPHDSRGDWAKLAEFYAPLIAEKAVYVSEELAARYSPQASAAVLLSEADARCLCQWLLEMTQDKGDRLTAGRTVLAAAFLPAQAHVLFRCEQRVLNQVIGRLKSRLAGLLIAHGRRRTGGRDVWGRGFWAAEILHSETAAEVRAFIETLGGAQCHAR